MTNKVLERRGFLMQAGGFLLLTSGVFYGCGGGGGGDKITIPQYALKPSENTVLLPADGATKVAEIGSDFVRLTGPIPTLLPGTILAGGGENSILRTVVSVESGGVIRTAPAGLMDAYTQGTVSVPFSFNSEELGTLVSEIPGVSLEWIGRGRSRADGFSQDLKISFKGVPLGASATISGFSTLTCRPLIPDRGWGDFYWYTNNTGRKEAGAFMGLTMTAGVSMSISAATQISESGKLFHVIKRKILAPRILSPTLWVWPVIDVFVEIGASMENKASVNITGSVQGNASYSWTSASGGKPNFSWEKSGSASVDGSAKISATFAVPVLEISFIPYVPTEKLLPETFLKVEPAILELSAECKIGDDSLKWSLDYEASMSAGIDFSILGKTIEKVETTLYKSPKVNVLNGKGLLCPTPTPIPGSNMPPSNPTAGQEWTNPKDGSVLIWVPSGTFQMGTNDFPGTYLGPVHSVTLSGFWMGKYEVTVGQYRAFCTATGRLMPTATPSWGWIDSHPMVYVDWNDAVAYGTWSGLKLPTEAQWEYAASGGDGRKWPWGNTWDGSRCANSVNPNSLSSTKPVGSYPSGVSPFGMLDMAGNVGEWCGDWSGPYGSGNATNPTGPSSGTSKTVRGGSWDSGGSVDGSGVLRCTWRSGNTPSNAYNSWGFRLSYPLPAP